MTDSLRIEATLLETVIRRVIQLDGSLTLDTVHEVLQSVFGWENRHLHEYSDDEVSTATSLRWLDAEGLAEGFDGLPEAEWSIASAFGASGGVLHYLYDFGDNWTHRLELLATRPALDGEPLARVIEGELAPALEDSGGPRGYATALEAWADPTHPLREYVLGAGGPWRRFDPERFDIDTVNDELAELDPATAPTPMMPKLMADLDEGEARIFRRYIAPVRRGATAEPAEIARFLHPYLWFIGRIGDAGVPVTDAGWLQPDFVREVMDELGWAVRYPGTVRSESSTPPVRRMKENLRALGLVRKYRGRLLPQAKTAQIVSTPERLWEFLATTIARLGTPAEVDATLLYAAEVALGGGSAGRDERVAFGLGALGWQLRGEEWPNEGDAAELATTVRRIFAELGEPRLAGPRDVATPMQRAFARAIVLAAP